MSTPLYLDCRVMQCPPDAPCAGEYHAPNEDPTCGSLPHHGCLKECPLTLALYCVLRSLVGCDSLPNNFPLRPRDRCTPWCMCRESVLRNIEGLLLRDEIPGQDGVQGVVDNKKL
jgi:hypothetical protein